VSLPANESELKSP
jgi:histidinol-phosphatase (PHP family)